MPHQEYETRALKTRLLGIEQPTQNHLIPGRSPCWVVPFERNSRFVDRDLLGKLKRTLFKQDSSGRIGIFGLGGVGKTQIALELAYQTRELYSDCSVIWLPAVDMESLHQAYVEIARRLGVGQFDPNKDDVKLIVQKHLSQPQSGRWLLIIDNADDIDMWNEGTSDYDSPGGRLRSFLPKSDQGATLFTTRSNRVAQYLAPGNIVEIPELDEAKALKVLRNSLANKNLLEDDHSSRTLLERLTFLPLAIVQAASFMNENQTDIASYVRILDGQGQDVIDLLSEEFEDEGRYKSIRNPVATTWLTSFTQIQKGIPLAADCLAFMSCINAKDIPVCLLPAPDGVEREKAIGVLRSYSFIRTSKAGTRLEMHRLVHLATRNWLRSIDSLYRWQSYSLGVLKCRFPLADTTRRSEWRAAIPHALHALDSTPNELNTDDRAYLMHMIGACYVHDGRYKEAEGVFLESGEILRRLFGATDCLTLKNQSLLAHAYQAMGQFEKSIKILENVLEEHERARGLENRDAMDVMAKLASSYRLSGNLQSAEELCSSVVRYYLKTLGPESHSTLNAIYSLTLIYYTQGRRSDSEKLAQQSLIIMKKFLGPDHSNTISATTNLADIYMECWRLKEAEELYLDGLERGRRINGPDHPNTTRDLHQLAWLMKLQGRHAEAISLLTECAQVKARVLGREHYQTVQTFSTLENWTTMK